MDISKDKVGVFMFNDGPVEVSENMPPERMWQVLKWALSEIETLRKRNVDEASYSYDERF
jgi:hypothetical protein